MLGTQALPEVVELTVPAWEASFPQIVVSVPCALEPNGDTETFELLPLPGWIETGLLAAEKALGELVAQRVDETNGEVHIYHGTP